MNKVSQPFYFILLLILGGEAVFILPFVMPRIFRPTYLDLFQIDNLELGYCFSLYGFVALISYLAGGVIADKFAPGKIMGVALVMTGLGGFYLSTFPSLLMLKCLYAYWGCTTILLFWAAMIKATRIWGGQDRQGKAFGFLDGGRGLVAAVFGSLGLWVLAIYVIGDFDELSRGDRMGAFQKVIFSFSTIVCAVGVLIFFLLKDNSKNSVIASRPIISLSEVKSLMKYKTLWLMMVIILTGYCGYKVTDVFSLYASEVMLYSEIDAAGVGTLLLYIRPIIGVVIGFLADISKSSKWLTIGFGLMLIGSLLISIGIIHPDTIALFWFSILVTSLGVYGIRSLYFAILEEGSIPQALTGTAVGLISFIGYTPDIFMGPLIGVLLDNYPNPLNFQYVFGVTALFSMIGFIACLLFIKWNRKGK
jgi:sugar phosphate permease